MTIAALRAIQDEARLTTVQLLENVEYLLSSGCTPAGIAARLGMEMEAIEKRCYRAGRHDLAVPFNGAVKQQRRLGGWWQTRCFGVDKNGGVIRPQNRV